MVWALKNPDAGKLIATFKFHGAPIPAGLIEPKFNDTLERDLYSAFWEVSTDRPEALRPIPWSAIRRYSRDSGYSQETFAEVMRRMDNAYLEYHAEARQNQG